MNIRLIRYLALICLGVVMGAAVGCRQDDVGAHGPAAERELLESPRAGDLYAAELTYFSEASFEERPVVYGLMKVLAVEGEEITLITENAGSDSADVPTREIRGDLAGIEFDESERIIISLQDLQNAQSLGKVFAVRR
jgi:hypothetical protein